MKVLIIDSAHRVLIDNLKDAGFEIVHEPEFEREDILREIEDYDVIIVRSKIIIDKEVIDKAIKLKCIARVGAGMDAIDVEYAEKKGIKCLNSPEGNRDAVGEHALGMLLSLFNKISIADHQVRKGIWKREENRGLEIKGKTIGLIGYGNMGNAFAQRLTGFDCRVLAYDKYKTNYSNQFAQEVSLETIFKETDILSLHVPLTEETKYMVDNAFISNFQKPIYLINTSRGKVVRTMDLTQKIKEGKILGACLDVLEYEEFTCELCPKDNIPQDLIDLLQMPNTIFSPHIAGWTVESYYKLAYNLSQKIIQTLKATE
ncbi:MAG: NAD(P)-dependent oxidoreductase [Bacteroidales bacterium]|jgi:D-3-phosphoglycerate dehydrogenase|nr:NAD(P)-dependent oxidoreductase [Bacteroidales bacterium]MDD4703681.1 NAD(P)-dependent oxidoreductase [Bacteroidales bacterium]MDX9798382.1 NAD(P)-dependent oxidoreductase [Bacteroidales bacterium]